MISMLKSIERRLRALEHRDNSAITGAVRLQNDGAESTYKGGVVAGSVNWNTTTGQPTGGSGTLLNESGLYGVKAGVKQFSIDSATGNATFAGDLSAAGGTFSGNLSAAGGTFSGALSAATGTFSGSLSASSITGSTITGSTITTDDIYDQTYGFSGVFVKQIRTSTTSQEDFIVGPDSGGLLTVTLNYTDSGGSYKILPGYNTGTSTSYYRTYKSGGNYVVRLYADDIDTDVSHSELFITALFNSNEAANSY